MASGVYGTIRPADMLPSDVEMTVFYSANRESSNTKIFSLDSANLIQINNPNNTSGFEIFSGLYTLRLPISEFGTKGIYTITFKPREIRTKIVDCGVLSAFPDIKGIVLDTSDPNTFESVGAFENNNLVGYRVEYINTDATASDRKIKNFFRIANITNRLILILIKHRV